MVLGITGISGAGKHTAAEFFAQRGWIILDADTIAHHLYRPYTHVWKAIVEHFGEAILNRDDTINRQKLGPLVFGAKKRAQNGEALKTLNAIVHPALLHELTDKIHRHFRRGTNFVIVAALWKELELEKLCDKVLLIQADPKLAFQRIQQRDSISKKQVEERLKHQSIPPHPSFVVENNRTIQEFYRKLLKLSL